MSTRNLIEISLGIDERVLTSPSLENQSHAMEQTVTTVKSNSIE